MTLEKVESYFGGKIDPMEYELAAEYARRKLAQIEEREHTKHDDNYLAMLTAEVVSMNRFSVYCDQIRIKKEPAPIKEYQSPSPPIVYHSFHVLSIGGEKNV
jgi:hypothetical protein